MGVEYQHFLIPEDNTYRPGPPKISKLVNFLLQEGFVINPESQAFEKMRYSIFRYYEHAKKTGCFVQVGREEFFSFPCPCNEQVILELGDGDFKIVWPVENLAVSGLKHPIVGLIDSRDAFQDIVPEEIYYEIEIHFAKDYVYHLSECIEPFNETTCSCGQELECFESVSLYGTRIHRICPACGKVFRPQDHVARLRSGQTGEISYRQGGATYLFAIVIDCGKCFPRGNVIFQASAEFLKTCSNAIGAELYQVGDFW